MVVSSFPFPLVVLSLCASCQLVLTAAADSEKITPHEDIDAISRRWVAESITDAGLLNTNNIPYYELQALQDFYDSTGGDHWKWTASLGNTWNFTADANPCLDDWQGIMCDETSTPFHVERVVLETCNLVGAIPESFGMLSELKTFEVDHNSLSGPLPSSLVNITGLEHLVLSYNDLGGPIPEYVSLWHNLIYLEMSDNYFTGTISPSHCQLRQLKVYDIAGNMLEGTIPDCYQNMTQLNQFVLSTNALEGPLPLSLSNLTTLTYIYLYVNMLTGHIPDSYGNLNKMTNMDFYRNQLSGTLPQSFGSMKGLTQYLFGYNQLTGTLPAYVGSLPQLTFIDISANHINGTLPNSLGNLLQMQRLYMFYNDLTGTIPASLGNCTKLWFLGFYNNYLTGTIPTTLGGLTMLEYFEIDSNMISGTIPDTFYDTSILYAFYAFSNALTGPLPPSLGNCSILVFMNVQYNMLTGPFPPGFFDNFVELYSFDIATNLLTGTVPNAVGRVAPLQYFNIFDNVFTGTLPSSMGGLYYLQYMFMGENFLTGSVPDTFENMAFLEQFFLDINFFTGTLPAGLSTIPYLQFLSIQRNMLTGTVPPEFSQLSYLIELILNNNYLTGPLYHVFNSSMQYELATVVVNNNRFTGTLPSEPFRLQNLDSFSGVSNCFHGKLPEAICNSTTLSTLALDGLSSAISCRNALFPGVSDSYIVTRVISGTIPTCLYHMPQLTTLHLSGNGFTGTLPERPINPFLIDLSLAHNTLTGTIPAHMQKRKWYNLDLSYNRLSGTLLSDFQSERLNASFYKHLSDLVGLNITGGDAQSSLSLENNRLSGRIPKTLQHKANVSVLGSNLFTCNLQASDLPEHDPGRDNYQCDSQEFNVPFYIWLSVVVTFLIALLLVWRFQDRIVAYYGIDYALGQIMKWIYVLEVKGDLLDPSHRLPSYVTVLDLSYNICKTAAYCTVYILVVMLPVLGCSSAYFGTFTHQYAWAVSAAYTSGIVPGALMITFLIGLMVLTIVGFSQYIHKYRSDPERSAAPTKKPLPLLNVMLIYTTFIIANLTVVVGANVAYVYVAIYGKSDILLLAQLVLSLFKLFWNRFFSIHLIRWTARLLSATRADEVDPANPPELQLVSLQVFVALLNNVAIPCLVVAVISPSCFHNVFVGAPRIDTVYTYQVCALVDGSVCADFVVGSILTSYPPPFTYNYQCSSSFITYYAPAFVLLCMMRTFLTPLLQYALYVLHRRALAQPNGNWYKLLDMVIPANLKPIDSADAIVPSLYKPYFDANQMVLSLITYLGLLLTFGAVFPPMAVALLVTLLSVLYFNKLKLGRYLSIAAEKGLFAYVDIIEVESKRAGFLPVLEKSLWMLITISCWFYTLFLFDTLGDAVGFDGAYWVLIVMPLMPLVLYVLYKVVMAGMRRQQSARNGLDTTKDVESEGTTMNVLQGSTIEMGPGNWQL